MTYIVGAHNTHLGSISVQVPARALRPRENTQVAPHITVSSPLMASRLLRPRGSGAVSAALADRFVGRVIALKGKQGDLEKLLASMVNELKNVANCAAVSQNQVQKQACLLRKGALEKAIDAAVNQIKALSAQANTAAIDAVKEGASQKEVIAAAASVTSSSGNSAVVESATIQVTPSGVVVPGPGATISAEPVLTTPNAQPAAAVNAAVAAAGPSLFKLALLAGAAYGAYRVLRKA